MGAHIQRRAGELPGSEQGGELTGPPAFICWYLQTHVGLDADAIPRTQGPSDNLLRDPKQRSLPPYSNPREFLKDLFVYF